MDTDSTMSLMYTIETPGKLCQFPANNTSDLDSLLGQEDPRTEALRRYSYGVVLPAICCLGIVGNVLNLVVLTRKNMRGTAYIYMRAKYINKCKLSDPKLNDCVKEQATKLLANILDGDENLGIPSLNPIRLSRLLLTPTKKFQFELRYCNVYGINNTKINAIKIDPKFQTLEFTVVAPNPSWLCIYKANGELLNNTVNDTGFINITYVNLVGEYTADYQSVEIGKTSYYQVKDGALRLNVDNISYNLTHIDGSDDTQAKLLTKLFSDEFYDFEKEFIPTSKIVSSNFITLIINAVFGSVPSDMLFDSTDAHSGEKEEAPAFSGVQEGVSAHSEGQKGPPTYSEGREGAPIHSEELEGSPALTGRQEGMPAHSVGQKGPPTYSEGREGAPIHSEEPEGSPALSGRQEGVSAHS